MHEFIEFQLHHWEIPQLSPYYSPRIPGKKGYSVYGIPFLFGAIKLRSSKDDKPVLWQLIFSDSFCSTNAMLSNQNLDCLKHLGKNLNPYQI